MQNSKIAQTGEELKSKILQYISLHSKSGDTISTLFKDRIISYMVKIYDTDGKEIEELLDDLESDDKVKKLRVEQEIYYLKSKTENVRDKIIIEGLRAHLIGQSTLILISFILLSASVYVYNTPSQNFTSITEANKTGVLTGIALSFFAVNIVPSLIRSTSEFVQSRKFVVKKNMWNISMVIIGSIGILGFVYNQSLVWQIAGLILAILSALRFRTQD